MPSTRVRALVVESRPVGKVTKKLPWPRLADDGVTQLGVDVVAKRTDVIKIVHKYFRVPEIPMEELLQEVFLAIIHKNHSASANDPRKSSFGHYVYMVADRCCIALVHRKRRFANERESLDGPANPGDNRTLMDTMEAPPPPPDHASDLMEEAEEEMRRLGMGDEARYVRAVRSGASPEVVREALAFGDRKVTTKLVRDWRSQVKSFLEDSL
jgi:hypothetical protein